MHVDAEIIGDFQHAANDASRSVQYFSEYDNNNYACKIGGRQRAANICCAIYNQCELSVVETPSNCEVATACSTSLFVITCHRALRLAPDTGEHVYRLRTSILHQGAVHTACSVPHSCSDSTGLICLQWPYIFIFIHRKR